MITVSGAGIAQQAMDPVFAENQKAWTTRPEFSSPLVDHLPASSTVPSPRDVLGHDIGAPGVLHHYADMLKYYRTLAATSPRVKIIETGQTEEGRPTIMVLISSDENIRSLETNRQNHVKLSDPRGLTEAQAKEIIAHTKPMYLVLGGLHSGETGPPEMLMEMTYRLATEDSPLIAKIRRNVIVGINPATDPDGRDRYTDWYYRHKIDNTDDTNQIPGPPFWGKYIFHDNNRDINYTGLSARNLLAFYLQWRAPIMHDLHESIGFLYSYSGQAPQNPTFDPIVFAEMPWIANFEMAQLTKYGMPGVWNHGFADAWAPGYVVGMANNHNGLSKLYETFGNGGATTQLRHIQPVNGPGQNLQNDGETEREWFRPSPAYKTVLWSMRNNTNYMQTGVLTSLQLVSENSEQIMENFYQKSRNSIESGRTEVPYAFIIPGDQPDMTRAALIINLLRQQGIEVGRTTADITIKEGKFPAGSFIIKRDQPYGRLAKVLLEKQNFPDPKLRTYDDSAWTMGMMAHVKVIPSADLAALSVAAQPLVEEYRPQGSIASAAGAATYAVLDQGSINMATLRYRLRATSVRIAEQSFESGGPNVPAGSFIVQGVAYEKLKAAVVPLGLVAVALDRMPAVPMHEAALPRLAVYSTWGATQNVGWVRYAFDQFETPYDLIFKDEVKKGGLRAKYDVILVPSQGRSSKGFVFDIPMTGKPLPYTKTAQYPTHGIYGSSLDIRGGMGLAGLEELRRFVSDGGTLITLGDSSAVPAEFGITPQVEVRRAGTNFYAPGPIVTAEIIKPANPIFYGYTAPTTTVRWASTALLSLPVQDQNNVLMNFAGGDEAVQSGLMVGASEAKNRPAIINLPVGSGQVLMFMTNPIHRWQNFGEYRMLFNALFSYKVLRQGLGGPPIIPRD